MPFATFAARLVAFPNGFRATRRGYRCIRMRMRCTVAAVLAVAIGVAVTMPAAGAGVQHFFFAPGTTTSCELDFNMPKIGSAAFCQTYPHTESATLRPNGKLTICHGITCIGNPPDQVPTLVYGGSLSAGPFRCSSLQKGVKCVVTKTGHGFLISPTKITRV